ncbi:MAG: hypothetical protein A4S12_13370 [Proteobacteria bacterium SG_bin5]|nr:MAG: hypothetical protein A4S12_13370 [Proteobacteria bacterium SG_bin5]
MKALTGLVLAATALAAPALAVRGKPADDGITLTVAVDNVRVAKGVVHIDLCREEEFLKDCPISAETPAVHGRTVLVLHGLRPGTYAVEATLDENHNGKNDRALFGIPKEGVGFSNDAPIRLAPPRWKDAMFELHADKMIELKLRYFTGPRS